MTKSTITRERLEKIKSWRETYGAGSNVMLPAEEAEELARMALAEMDSEPVAYMYRDNLHSDARFSLESKIGNWSPEDINEYEVSETPLYRHAQQPTVAGDGRAEFETWMLKRWGRERRDDDFAMGKFIYGEDYADSYTRCVWKAWSASRAAMLQAGNSPVIPGAEQRIADAVELLKKAAPAMLAGNGGPDGPLAGRIKSPVIPDGWQVEAEKLAEMHGMSFVLFRHGEAPQCADPTKVVISFTDKGLGYDSLPAAPQEVNHG